MEYFPGFTSIKILRQIQKDLNARQVNPEQFEEIILFMSMFNDSDLTMHRNYSECTFECQRIT